MSNPNEPKDPKFHGILNAFNVEYNEFSNFKEIGAGKDCKVYAVDWPKFNRKVVIKQYDKSKISSIKFRSIKREARMMYYLTAKSVPHMVEFYACFQDDNYIYLVMENCSNGDLLEQLLKEGCAMTEKRVVNEVVVPLFVGLSWMHEYDLIHRDIKLENIFVTAEGVVKHGDFGLTMSMKEERGISPVGTLEYMAPELVKLPTADLIINGKVHPDDVEAVDEKVDIWAMGVVVYELLTGRSPFEGEDKEAIKKNIRDYRMRKLPSFLSPEASSFIMKMLCYESNRRASAVELLQHKWIKKYSTHTIRNGAESMVSTRSGGLKSSPQLPQLSPAGSGPFYTLPAREHVTASVESGTKSDKSSKHNGPCTLPSLATISSDKEKTAKVKALQQPSDQTPVVNTEVLNQRNIGTTNHKVGHIFNKNKYTTSGAMDTSNSVNSKGRIAQMSTYLNQKVFGPDPNDVKKRVQLVIDSVPDDDPFHPKNPKQERKAVKFFANDGNNAVGMAQEEVILE